MLRSLWPQTNPTMIARSYFPASIRSATLTYFIAVPLGAINLLTMTMKTFRILSLFILLTACNQARQFEITDLPSKEQIDSVLTSAIKASSITFIRYSKQQIDSSTKNGIEVLPFFRLNSELLIWTNKNVQTIGINFFDFSFIKGALLRQGLNNLFNREDSLFFCFQIKHELLDTVNLKYISNISYTNSKEIKLNKDQINEGKEMRFAFCQFSQPLFNKSKSLSIIGFSMYDFQYHKPNHEGGIIMIMKKTGNNWSFMTDIDWWGH